MKLTVAPEIYSRHVEIEGTVLMASFSEGETWLLYVPLLNKEVEVLIVDNEFWEKVHSREYLVYANQVLKLYGVFRREDIFVAHKVISWM